MTSEYEQEPPATRAEAGVTAAHTLETVMQRADAFIGRFSQVARADACVGPVQKVERHTVVPVATVSLQAGMGMGFGGGSDKAQGQGSGGGGAGGGRGTARVIAVVDISDEGVNVRPVPDVTTIVLAFLALLGIGIIATRGRPGAGLLRFMRQQSLPQTAIFWLAESLPAPVLPGDKETYHGHGFSS